MSKFTFQFESSKCQNKLIYKYASVTFAFVESPNVK